MSPYAEGTKVPVERSRFEIEQLLRKNKASQILVNWDAEMGSAVCATFGGVQVRVSIPQPPKNKFGTAGVRYEREERRRWRCLILMLKAKFEAIANGVSTFENEFIGYAVLPNGTTLSDFMAPMLPEINRKMPTLLPESKP